MQVKKMLEVPFPIICLYKYWRTYISTCIFIYFFTFKFKIIVNLSLKFTF